MISKYSTCSKYSKRLEYRSWLRLYWNWIIIPLFYSTLYLYAHSDAILCSAWRNRKLPGIEWTYKVYLFWGIQRCDCAGYMCDLFSCYGFIVLKPLIANRKILKKIDQCKPSFEHQKLLLIVSRQNLMEN